MKNKKLRNKIIVLISIIIVIILISIIFVHNGILKKEVKENGYLASGNANSELIANNIKKGVTIGGITGTLESLDTSDATATAEDILKGETAYVDGNKIIGILELLNTSDATATAADIVSGKTAYVNGEKVTGTLSTYKYATGSCTTRDARDYGDTWCTVTSLTFKPFMVVMIGTYDSSTYGEGPAVAYVLEDGGRALYGHSFTNYLDVTFKNNGFVIKNVSNIDSLFEWQESQFYAIGL